ncbi:eukaryotic aspartyl protease [Ostertagia ostertagi]
MTPESNSNGYAGELTLCGTDPARYKGSIAWSPVVTESYWIINASQVYVGRMPIINGTAQVAVDTGSGVITGPRDAIQKIVQLTGATSEHNGAIYSVDCKNITQLPPITFNIACRSFVMQGPDYVVKAGADMCVLGFAAVDFPSKYGFSWILGDVFLRNFYSVFDVGNKRVGLAPAV